MLTTAFTAIISFSLCVKELSWNIYCTFQKKNINRSLDVFTITDHSAKCLFFPQELYKLFATTASAYKENNNQNNHCTRFVKSFIYLMSLCTLFISQSQPFNIITRQNKFLYMHWLLLDISM